MTDTQDAEYVQALGDRPYMCVKRFLSELFLLVVVVVMHDALCWWRFTTKFTTNYHHTKDSFYITSLLETIPGRRVELAFTPNYFPKSSTLILNLLDQITSQLRNHDFLMPALPLSSLLFFEPFSESSLLLAHVLQP